MKIFGLKRDTQPEEGDGKKSPSPTTTPTKSLNRSTTLVDTSLRFPKNGGSPTQTSIFSRLKTQLEPVIAKTGDVHVAEESHEKTEPEIKRGESFEGLEQVQHAIAQAELEQNEESTDSELLGDQPKEKTIDPQRRCSSDTMAIGMLSRGYSFQIPNSTSRTKTMPLTTLLEQNEDCQTPELPNQVAEAVDAISQNITETTTNTTPTVEKAVNEPSEITESPKPKAKPKRKKSSGMAWADFIQAANAGEIEEEPDIMIGTIPLSQLIEKTKTDHKYGYLTVDQIFEFGLRYAFEDEKFNSIFMCTYKTFISPKILVPTLRNALSKLTPQIYGDEEKNMIVHRASIFLSAWVNSCYQDFQFDKQVVEELFTFIGNTLNTYLSRDDFEGHYKVQERVVEMCEAIAKRISGMEEEVVIVAPPVCPKSIVMNRIPNDPRTLKLEDIHPIEVARQLTLIEFGMFEKVNAEELLGLGWMKDSKEWTAPNISQIISRSNQVTDWVTTYILNEKKLKQRQRLLKQFLAVADACYEMNNYNTLFEIMMALVSQPVYRLKLSWEGIGKSDREKYIKYDTITNFAGNRRAYREELKRVKLGSEPCLPYIGVHLTDLVFFEQGNTGHKFEGELMYINLTKRSQMALVVNQLMQSQKKKYAFNNVEYIQMFFSWQFNKNVMSSEDAMHKLSKELEP